MFGDRKDMAGYAVELAAQGFTAIAPEYRLLGEAPWPAQIQDVRDVIAWVDSHAEALGLSPAKIAVMGMSAGGHLALLAAGVQDEDPFGGADGPTAGRIAAVVSAFAPPVIEPPPPQAGPNPIAALLGPPPNLDKARAASPMTYVSRRFPPTFLLNGAADGLVTHQATLALFQALDAAGVPVDLHIYHGHTHEFTRLPSMLAPVQAEVALFLKRAMVDPEGYALENRELNPFARPGGPPMPGPPPAA